MCRVLGVVSRVVITILLDLLIGDRPRLSQPHLIQQPLKASLPEMDCATLVTVGRGTRLRSAMRRFRQALRANSTIRERNAGASAVFRRRGPRLQNGLARQLHD